MQQKPATPSTNNRIPSSSSTRIRPRPINPSKRRARARNWGRLCHNVTLVLEVLPALVLVGIFVYGTASGVAQGLGYLPFLGKTKLTFSYLASALQREDFLAALSFSLSTSGIAALIALIGGIALAAALAYGGFGSRVRAVVLQLPIMSMHALVALALSFMFAGSGLFARVLFALGLVGSPADFPGIVGAPSGWGIVAVYVWKEIPYVAFVTFTLLQQVSSRLGQAAQVLGATPWQAFVHVVLPLCLPAALRAGLVVFVFALGAYEVPFLLGPTAPKALPVLAYMEFTKPDIANRAYAMALDSLMLAVCVAAALGYVALLVWDKRRAAQHG